MAGTSIPFFLYPTGSTPKPPASGGVRSFLAFWMGGAAAKPFTPPPPPPHVILSVDGGLPGRHRRKRLEEERREERAKQARAEGFLDLVRDQSGEIPEPVAILLLSGL